MSRSTALIYASTPSHFYDGTNDNDHNMRSFFAQQDHLRVFHCVKDCLHLMDI